MNQQQIEWALMAARIEGLARQAGDLHRALGEEANRADSPYGTPGAMVHQVQWDLEPLIKKLNEAHREACARTSPYGPYSDAALAEDRSSYPAN